MSTPLCGAKKTDGSGDTCKHQRGWGTDHPGKGRCKLHGGATGNHRKAAKKAIAVEAVKTYGLPADVDPHDALLEEVHRTAGHVRWIGDIIADLESDALIWGLASEVDKGSGEFPGTDVTKQAAPNVWLDLYHRERAHLVKVAKAAIDAGIDERRVQLAEEQGRVIVDVLRATLTDLGVDVTPEVAATVGKHLRLVDGGRAA